MPHHRNVIVVAVFSLSASSCADPGAAARQKADDELRVRLASVETQLLAIQAEQRPPEAFDPSESVPADQMAAELREIMAQRWPGK